MSTRFTRVIGGLNEWTEVPLDEERPFSNGRFRVLKQGSDWILEPIAVSPAAYIDEPGVTLNDREISEPRTLTDDDVVGAGVDHWIFRDGAVARDVVVEQAALDSAEGSRAWHVMADWLTERGDPLGSRVMAHLEQRLLQVPIGQPYERDTYVPGLQERHFTSDSMFRMEVDLEHGLPRRLIARSMSHGIEADLLTALLTRRMRFLEHLVIDSPRDQVATLSEHFAQWPLPRWLKTISFGAFDGPPPVGWNSPGLPAQILSACPRLRPEPFVRFHASAKVEIASESPQLVQGLAPGRLLRLLPGTLIEQDDDGVHVHSGPPRSGANRHYIFQLDGDRWHLTSSDVNGRMTSTRWSPARKQLKVSIGGWAVRATPLLHGDRIVIEPDVVLRFGLHD